MTINEIAVALVGGLLRAYPKTGPAPSESNKIRREWLVRQINTSSIMLAELHQALPDLVPNAEAPSSVEPLNTLAPIFEPFHFNL